MEAFAGAPLPDSKERGKKMAWYDSFGAEFLRELGLEWWFHRKGRGAATGGTTTGGTTPAAPKSLLDWVEGLPPVYRRGLKELPQDELAAILALKGEEREAALIKHFGLPPTLLESLRKAAWNLENKLESSPDTRKKLEDWAAWLRRIK